MSTPMEQIDALQGEIVRIADKVKLQHDFMRNFPDSPYRDKLGFLSRDYSNKIDRLRGQQRILAKQL